MTKKDKISRIASHPEVLILRGKHKGQKGIVVDVEFEDNGEIKDDQIDVKTVGGEMCYLGIDDIKILPEPDQAGGHGMNASSGKKIENKNSFLDKIFNR